jgi:hypothetical protein
MTYKEKRKAIAKALKDAGYNSRRVSIRSKGNSFRLIIRCGDVDPDQVERIARNYQTIHRCEATQEILSGGNTFVFVDWDRNVKLAIGEQSMYRELLTKEVLSEATDFQGVSIGPFTFFQSHPNQWTMWVEDNGDRHHIALDWRTGEISTESIANVELAHRAYQRRQEKHLAR